MKYSATMLLFAAAVFWSSASARLKREVGQEVDAFTRGLIIGLNKYVPELHRIILVKKVHDVQYRHWDDITDYMDYIKAMLAKYIRESCLKAARGKQDVDSDEELYSDEISPKILYGVHARLFVSAAPPAHREALLEKYTIALEKEYEDEIDFREEATQIFEEETGLHIDAIESEVRANEGTSAEILKKFAFELVKALTVGLDEIDSSEDYIDD